MRYWLHALALSLAFSMAPALAQGDGPIGKYRAWAAQFYE